MGSFAFLKSVTAVALILTVIAQSFAALSTTKPMFKVAQKLPCDVAFNFNKTMDAEKALKLQECTPPKDPKAKKDPSGLVCITNCKYEKRGLLSNEKVQADKVKDFYTKLTNGTAAQVTEIVQRYTKCATETSEKVAASKKTGKGIGTGKCDFAKLFDTCVRFAKSGPRVCALPM